MVSLSISLPSGGSWSTSPRPFPLCIYHMILENNHDKIPFSLHMIFPTNKNKYGKIDPWQIFPRHGLRCKSTMLPTVKKNCER